ncbi:MAG: hypothetical protein ABI123_08820 [Ginsengibacter sp.]
MSHFAFCCRFFSQVLAIAMMANTGLGVVTIMRFKSEGINAKESKKKYGD